MAGFHPSCEASLAPWEMIYRGRFSEVLKRHFHNTNKMRTDCGTTGDAWLGVCEANTGRSNKMTKTHHSLSISMTTNVLMRSISRCISKTVPHTPNEEIFKRRKNILLFFSIHTVHMLPRNPPRKLPTYMISPPEAGDSRTPCKGTNQPSSASRVFTCSIYYVLNATNARTHERG